MNAISRFMKDDFNSEAVAIGGGFVILLLTIQLGDFSVLFAIGWIAMCAFWHSALKEKS